jgi:hypothetical protein
MWDVKIMFLYHSLRAGGPGIESRWERDLPHPSRPAPGPTKPPVLPGLFLGVKRPERGVDHPSPSSTEVKESVDIYLYSPSGLPWSVLGRPLPCRVSVTARWRSVRLRCRCSARRGATAGSAALTVVLLCLETGSTCFSLMYCAWY